MWRPIVNIYLRTLFRLNLRKAAKTKSRRRKTNPITNLEYRTKNEIQYCEIYHFCAVCLITFLPRSPKKVYLSLDNKKSYGQIWMKILLIQINHSIARMLNDIFINIISEAKLLKLFILTDRIIS
jgi:hypothetical protein